ncbi:MAG: DNA-processing protein DprA [Candidatus Peribacteria bacterium]|nr:MAG: DNA-processing protein DprA [Candidatus Peribacteria bacterium]
MTTYGKQAIEKIVPSLLENFCIISGGAMGCDAEAHKAALASSGSTIAVIGTGIDIDYPAFHSNLYDQIIS